MSEPKGLMAFWADFDDETIRDVRRWHNCEHMLERVSLPGFQRGRRYRGNGDAATFLMYYEADDAAALGSEAYQAALNDPTDWTRRALTHFRNPARSIYGLLASHGAAPATPAPFLTTLRFNTRMQASALLALYRDTVLPTLAAREAVIRARLWAIDQAITGIVSSERKIYGDGPGQQEYLLFVEMAAEIPPLMPADLPGLEPDQAAAHGDLFAETGWLDFALEAPDDT